MAGYDPLYLLTLVTVAFGALTFSVLVLFYWRERQSRLRSPLFRFSGICAAAFLLNLVLRIAPRWETPFTVALDVATTLVPPLLLHLAVRAGKRKVLFTFYSLGFASAVAISLDDLGLFSAPLRDQAPALMLGGAGLLGFMFVDVSPRSIRVWYRLLLGSTVLVVIASLVYTSALAMLAPDYLLPAFFCVTLYYEERFIFFDLLLKRGVFFGLALVLLARWAWLEHLPDPVTVGLTLSPFVLLGPWAYDGLNQWIDRAGMRRPTPIASSSPSCNSPPGNMTFGSAPHAACQRSFKAWRMCGSVLSPCPNSARMPW
jgi:hypothetical protein